MKRWTIALTGLALSAGLVMCVCARSGLAQSGGQSIPGNPFAPSSSPPKHPLLQGGNYADASANDSLKNWDPKANADIKVTPDVGEWMISVASYKGPNAQQWARELVAVLRARPYELWAYVYDYTPDALKKQDEYKQEQIQLYKAKLKALGQPIPTGEKIPIKIKKLDIQIEVGVILGGFKDQDSARRELDRIKENVKSNKFPCPDEKKVMLDKVWAVDKKTKAPVEVPVNPLTQGMLVRNPSLPKQAAREQEWDMSLLRSLNAGEQYSLLKCPRPFTLVVKEFRMPVSIQQAGVPENPLKKVSLPQASERTDAAYLNAQTLAAILREKEVNLESYVLHDRKSSLVTVGSFDNMNDPRIKVLQHRIHNLHRQFAQMAQQNPQYDPLVIFPIGLVMKVPQ
jgi:hypothetical protein